MNGKQHGLANVFIEKLLFLRADICIKHIYSIYRSLQQTTRISSNQEKRSLYCEPLSWAQNTLIGQELVPHNLYSVKITAKCSNFHRSRFIYVHLVGVPSLSKIQKLEAELSMSKCASYLSIRCIVLHPRNLRYTPCGQHTVVITVMPIS